MLYFMYFLLFYQFFRDFPQKIMSCYSVPTNGFPAVPRKLFFAAQQWIAIAQSPKLHQKNQLYILRKNQEEHGPDVM